MDSFNKEKRSWIMYQVKGKNTSPEKVVRSIVHRLGFRFRLHKTDLPGIPDLVFKSKKKVIFIHGCFWHGHNCRRGNRMPKTNIEYWGEKIGKNHERDKINQQKLIEMGWIPMIIWECQLKDAENIRNSIIHFLS